MTVKPLGTWEFFYGCIIVTFWFRIEFFMTVIVVVEKELCR
jgi:hypothetical protein